MASAAEVHRKMFDVIAERGIDALRDLYHSEYVYTATDGQEHKGFEAALEVAETYTNAFPDLRFEIREQFTPSDDVSIIELTARGTHQAELEGIPATGKSVELVGCNVIEVADGKIRREREYFDTMALMQQLGVAEA